MTKSDHDGFTLIELSIVLVIIGLIVGGVLVGQDLIRAAGARAQITQIEKYNTAANTFYGKYGALPGDLNASVATQFGFAGRGQFAGEGDGNGIIEGITSNAASSNVGSAESAGETVMFWVDLSKASLVDGNFSSASANTLPGGPITGTGLDSYYPQAKLGSGNYVYVWSGGWQGWQGAGPSDGVNYFAVSAIWVVNAGTSALASFATIPVGQAYNIDKKVDDGLPQSGRVMAMYPENNFAWAAGGGHFGNGGDYDHATLGPVKAGDGIATTGDSTTCYDNAGVAGATEQYSLSQNNGANPNCALSFRFQ